MEETGVREDLENFPPVLGVSWCLLKNYRGTRLAGEYAAKYTDTEQADETEILVFTHQCTQPNFAPRVFEQHPPAKQRTSIAGE